MSREWKPGDVLTNDSGALFFVVDHAPVDRGHVLYTEPSVVDADGNGWKRALLDSSARPLAVIDPEDREQVERLAIAYSATASARKDDEYLAWENRSAGARRRIVGDLQDALREYADPTPPKPEEPTGLGAVVEDGGGRQWVRAGKSYTDPNWRPVGGDAWARYEQIRVVRVLSEGVTA